MTRADWWLLMVTLLLLCWLYLTFWIIPKQGLWIRIWSSQQETMTLPLQENRKIKIKGALGDSTLIIQDGQVRFSESPCSNKSCIQGGWLKNSGEVGACLPNQVSVQIMGGISGYDAINF
jgi:hypothetical protein